MLFGMTIPTFRLTILALAVLAQLYLFYRTRRAIRSSQRSARFKTLSTRLVGAVIGLLFVVNAGIISKPLFTPVRLNAPPEVTLLHLK
jgi:hypothetical protein